MKRIIQTLRESDIECMPNERFTLDVDMFDNGDRDHPPPKNILFEEPEPEAYRLPVGPPTGSLFRYFLDGSQTFHHVIDASFPTGAYLPICAAQVGVAVLRRDESGRYRMLKHDLMTRIQRLLVVPRGHLDDNSVQEIEDRINAGLPPDYGFKVVRYDPKSEDKNKTDNDPENHARARVLKFLHETELETMQRLLDEQMIDQENWLALDGGLQFARNAQLERLLSNNVFRRYVIALAKKPDVNRPIKEGGGRRTQYLGNLIKGLEYGERTPAFSSSPDETLVRGSWYLRMRPRRFVYQPLQGVIKLEVFADTGREHKGLESARVDGISRSVLSERNVTPFKADDRWGNHLYPIYLTESYIKANFLGKMRFKALII